MTLPNRRALSVSWSSNRNCNKNCWLWCNRSDLSFPISHTLFLWSSRSSNQFEVGDNRHDAQSYGLRDSKLFVLPQDFRKVAKMKRFLTKLPNGNDEESSSMTIYSGEDFTGDSKTFNDPDKDMQKNGWKVPIKSVVVSGNPWIIYPLVQFKVPALESPHSSLTLSITSLHLMPGPRYVSWRGSIQKHVLLSQLEDGSCVNPSLVRRPREPWAAAV